MVSYNDIDGLIAIAIRNNRAGFIAAMNAAGNPVAVNISENELLEAARAVLAQKGVQGIQQVLSRVPVIKADISQPVKNAITAKFAPANQRSFGDWFNNTVQFFGDLLGGSATSVTGPTSQQQTSESAMSPAMIGLIVVLGLVLVVIFRKFIAVVIAIIVIVLAVVLYGIFAKSITTTVTGGSTTSTQHGGIGSTIASVLSGWFGLLSSKGDEG